MGRMPGSVLGERADTFVQALRRQSAELGADRAFAYLGSDGEIEDELSFADLDRQAQRLGAWLQSRTQFGDRVLLMFPPGLQFVAAFFGCLYAGLTAVPTAVPGNRRSLPRMAGIVGDAAPAAGLSSRRQLEATRRRWPEALESLEWHALEDALESEASDWAEPQADRSALALLQYTSGSTGDPKGVMVSHGNLLANSEDLDRGWRHEDDSVLVSWLPTYHDMGLIYGILQPVFAGIPCCLMAPAAFLQRPIRWLEAITRFRGTHSAAPNFAYELCLQRTTEEERSSLDLSSWKMACNGAEPVRASTLRRFVQIFGPYGFRSESLCPGYGLAEGTLKVTASRAGEPWETVLLSRRELEAGNVCEPSEDEESIELVSCGGSEIGTRVLIADPESGDGLAQGRIGEIWIRGETVAQGYWGRPGLNERTFAARASDGDGPWLRTGDLGFDFGGHLVVTGRIKELIIIRGRNLYPQDIEWTATRSHPALRPDGGAAFALRGESGEGLGLVLEVTREGLRGLESDEALEAAARAVAEAFGARPTGMALLHPGALPRTSSGKIKREACRLMWLSDGLRSVAVRREEDDPADAEEAWDRSQLMAAPQADRHAIVGNLLRLLLARALRLPYAEVDPKSELGQLGLDSLGAAELQMGLEERLGIDLPVSWLLSDWEMDKLAGRILALLEPEDDALSSESESALAGEAYPLTLNQQGLWLLHGLSQGNAAYNIVLSARIRPAPTSQELLTALTALLRRHPALRSRFFQSDGQPMQRIGPAEPEFEHEEASDWDGERALQRLREHADRPFDLEAGPLLRGLLLRLDESEALLSIAVHHICADFWTMAMLLDELSLILGGESADWDAGRPYAEFAAWQKERLRGESGERLWQRWKERLEDAPSALEIPSDRPRPPMSSLAGASRGFELSPGLSRRVRDLSKSSGATLFATLAAAYQAFLGRLSGQSDLVVGSPSTGRTRAAFARTAGYFVNLLPLRADLSSDPSVGDLIGQARRRTLQALDDQDFPFQLMVERLHPQRDPSRHPLAQATFALQKPPLAPGLAGFALDRKGTRAQLRGLQLECLGLGRRWTQFDLSMSMAEMDDRLAGSLEFSTDLFEEKTVERMAAQWATLLRGAVENPGLKISQLPLMTASERRELVECWGGQAIADQSSAGLHRLFTQRVQQDSDAVALSFEGRTCSYGQLRQQALELAARLQTLGARPERIVGLCLEPSFDLVSAAVGILESGAAYLPLDPGHPPERLVETLIDSGAIALVTSSDVADRLSQAGLQDIPWLSPGNEERDTAGAARFVPPSFDPQQAAYVIYTSGSTGKPKGVVVSHRNAVRLLTATERWFRFDHRDVWTLFHSAAFDFSVWEMWGALAFGGRLVIVSRWFSRSPEAFRKLLLEERVTVLNQTPSAFRAMLQTWQESQSWPIPEDSPQQTGSDHASGRAGRASPFLRYVIFGGEALDFDSLAPWMDRFGDDGPRFINMYGITETTVHVTYRPVIREDLAVGAGSFIGEPIPDLGVRVADRRLRLAPIGVQGELCVEGPGLARGYLGRPRLTAERFTPSPFSRQPGARLYRSGDAARLRESGELEYLGRLDRQVKVRGYRIELGEIESELNRIPEVGEAAVLLHGQRLAAWVQPRSGQSIQPREIVAGLKSRLPDYMVPTEWTSMQRMPRTSGGKIDRRRLPAPSSPRLERSSQPARTHAEEVVRGLFRELLERDAESGDSFFDLGGHSLLAARLAWRMRQALGADVGVRQIFENPTPQGLAAAAERSRSVTSDQADFVGRAAGNRAPLSYPQQGLWLADRLEGAGAAYNVPLAIRLQGRASIPALERSLQELVVRHEPLRTRLEEDGGQAEQVIDPPPRSLRLLRVDLAALPAERASQECANILSGEADRPFDLQAGPLLRTLLIEPRGEAQGRAADPVLLAATHHVATDGWSTLIHFDELGRLYAAFRQGRPSPLDPLPARYADWAVWQRQRLSGERLNQGVRRWAQRIGSAPKLPQLLADFQPPPRRSWRGASLHLSWNAEECRLLHRLAKASSCSLFMTLAAGWCGLLGRLGFSREMLLGMPEAGRPGPQAEGLAGMFVNTLVLRVDVSGRPCGRELLARVREVALDAQADRETPFEEVAAALEPDRGSTRPTIFRTMLSLHPGLPRNAAWGDLAAHPYGVPMNASKFELSLLLEEGQDRLEGRLEYSTDLYQRGSIERLSRQLKQLLGAIGEDPGRPLDELPAWSRQERGELLRGSTPQAPSEGCLHELFAQRALRHPDCEAIAQEDGSWLTYGELLKRARQVAAVLGRLEPEPPVGIVLPLGAQSIAAQIGTLLAGGSCLPLAPDSSRDSLHRWLEEAGSRIAVTLEGWAEGLSRAGQRLVLLDREESAAQPAQAPLTKGDADRLAYVFVSSDSDGRGPGTALSHAALSASASDLGLDGTSEEGTCLAALGPQSHLALCAVWRTLLGGGRLVPLPQPLPPQGLKRAIADVRPSSVWLDTALLDALGPSDKQALDGLRVPLSGRRPLAVELLAELRRLCPKTAFVNVYGAGYGGGPFSAAALSSPCGSPPAAPLIGAPLPGARVLLADEHLRPATDGAAGEMHVGGRGLAQGCFGRPRETAQRFLPDPLGPPGGRLYRTRDFARLRCDGGLEFLGQGPALDSPTPLAEPEERQEQDRPQRAPSSPYEEVVRRTFAELLDLEEAGGELSFFEAGGHSLLAMRLASRLKRALNLEVEGAEVFEAPTPAELGRLLERRAAGGGDGDVAILEKAGAESPPPPPSFAQERLWLLCRLQVTGPAYNIPLTLELRGPLREETLRLSLEEIGRRHEPLRTVFPSRDGRPHPSLLPMDRLRLPRIELQGLPPQRRATEGQRLIEELRQEHFDLERGPLWRTALIGMGDGLRWLALTVHHIAADGWSLTLLENELESLYSAFETGSPSPLAPLPVRYSDYARWQRRRLSAQRLESGLMRWKDRLKGIPESLELATDRPRPAVRRYRGGHRRLLIGERLGERLRKQARELEASLFMTLLAGFAALLSRCSGQDETVIGTPSAGRPLAETEPLIGFFVNLLPLRCNLQGGPGFADFTRRLRQDALQAYADQETPFEKLVDALQPDRSLSRTPLFQALLSLQPASRELRLGRARMRELDPPRAEAQYDLTLWVEDSGPGEPLRGALVYDRDLFDGASIELLRDRLLRLLEEGTAHPERPIPQLSLLGEAERQELLELGECQSSADPGRTLVKAFQDWTQRAPEAPAARYQGRMITYSRLDAWSGRVARRLVEAGAGPETLIGLCVHPSLELAAAVLGILKSGAAWTPLDPEHPPQRLAWIIEDAELSFALVDEETSGLLGATGLRELRVDSESDPDAFPHIELPDPIDASQLAYAIYTSGSTGKPKGVLTSQGGLARLAMAKIDTLAMGPGSVVLQLASLNFDASVMEMASAWWSGAMVCFAPRKSLLPGPGLAQLLESEGVTHVVITPSALARIPDSPLPRLSHLLAAGEECPPQLAQRWIKGRRLFNAYGPTEASVCSTMAEIDDPPGPGRLPLGSALRHVSLRVLDRHLEPVPCGMPGELCIGGAGLARGYLGRPSLTADRFRPDPFSKLAGKRLYLTGDSARWRPDGQTEFLGRIDRQVKIRGVRVEPGELEGALAALPGVAHAAAVARPGPDGGLRLVAYAAPPEGDWPPDPQAWADGLRQALRRRLPSHLLPAALVPLREMPRSPSGKLDRRSLPEPDPLQRSSLVAPRTSLENQIARAWQTVLSLESVGIEDSFFDLGGHSLLLTQVHEILAQTLDAPLSVVDLFQFPTIASLAQYLEERSDSQARSAKAAAAAAGAAPRKTADRAAARQRRQDRAGIRKGHRISPSPTNKTD